MLSSRNTGGVDLQCLIYSGVYLNYIGIAVALNTTGLWKYCAAEQKSDTAVRTGDGPNLELRNKTTRVWAALTANEKILK